MRVGETRHQPGVMCEISAELDCLEVSKSRASGLAVDLRRIWVPIRTIAVVNIEQHELPRPR